MYWGSAWPCIIASTVGGGVLGCVVIIVNTIGGVCRAIIDFNLTGQCICE